MDELSRDKQFRKWLSEPQTLKLLARTAGDIARSLRNHPYLGTSLSIPIPDGPVTEDVIEGIVSELCLFLLENLGRMDKIPFAGNPAAYLRQSFLNHLREMSRRQDTYGFHYLYKRAADILRKAPDIFTSAVASNITVFSLQKRGQAIQPLTLEDFSEIPFPVEHIAALTYEAVNKKAALLVLARYFWRKLSDLYGGAAIEIPLKDFITWIGLHVPLVKREKSLSAIDGGFRSDGEKGCAENQLSDPTTQPDRAYFDPAAVKTWACNFARRLSPRQKQVFALRHVEELGYADIARQTGYRGPPGPKMAVKDIEAQLRNFLIELPWVSPDGCRDPNPAALALFWQTLFDALKKELSTPS